MLWLGEDEKFHVHMFYHGRESIYSGVETEEEERRERGGGHRCKRSLTLRAV